MITLLIIDYDLSYAKKIINTIVSNNEQMRLVDIATSTREATNIILKYKPHIAIINTDVVDMEKINSLNPKMKKILLTGNHEKWLKGNCILKSDDLKILDDSVSQLLSKYEFAQTKEQLIKTLLKLKFNFALRGTLYLMDCISYCYENKETYSVTSLSTTLYPIIAQKYNKPLYQIINSIKETMYEMYDRNYIENTIDYVEEFFFLDKNETLTPKLILLGFMSRLD